MPVIGAISPENAEITTAVKSLEPGTFAYFLTYTDGLADAVVVTCDPEDNYGEVFIVDGFDILESSEENLVESLNDETSICKFWGTNNHEKILVINKAGQIGNLVVSHVNQHRN